MPIDLRLTWIIEFMKQSEDGRAENWFNNIRGIIEGFARFGLAEPGTWLSYVDAGILHSIQDGYALSLNLGGTPRTAAIAWKEFFDNLYQGARDEDVDSVGSYLVSLWGTTLS